MFEGLSLKQIKIFCRRWESDFKIQKQPSEVFCQKMYFSNFTGKYLCWSFFLIKLQACEICVIFTNTYFQEHLRTTASDNLFQAHVPFLFFDVFKEYRKNIGLKWVYGQLDMFQLLKLSAFQVTLLKCC